LFAVNLLDPEIIRIVIPQRKIPARDWSKSRHVAFTNTPQSPLQQQRSDIKPSMEALLTEGTIWLTSSSRRRRSRFISIQYIYDHADVEFIVAG